MDNITIRTATLADLDVIAAHNVAMAAETEGLPLNPDVVRSGVRRVLIDDARGTYYLAVRGREVIGQLLITREWSDWRDDWFWWIQSVYVVPEARGTGVYGTLHRYVEQLARRTRGVCGLRLYVDRGNTLARQVYEQLGMHEASYEFMELSWDGLARGSPPAGGAPPQPGA